MQEKKEMVKNQIEEILKARDEFFAELVIQKCQNTNFFALFGKK